MGLVGLRIVAAVAYSPPTLCIHEDVLRLFSGRSDSLKFDTYVVLKMADGPDWRLDNDKKTITITFPTEPPMSCKLQTAFSRRPATRSGNVASRHASRTPL